MNKKGNSTELFTTLILFWFTLSALSIWIGHSLVSDYADVNDELDYNGVGWQEYVTIIAKIMFFQVEGVPIPLVLWFNLMTVLSFYSLLLMIRGIGG